jgi:hypothetical protein
MVGLITALEQTQRRKNGSLIGQADNPTTATDWGTVKAMPDRSPWNPILVDRLDRSIPEQHPPPNPNNPKSIKVN